MSESAAPTAPPAFPIVRVENFDKWFAVLGNDVGMWVGRYFVKGPGITYRALVPAPSSPLVFRNNSPIAFIRYLYDKTIGDVADVWAAEDIPIEDKYAQVAFRDLFEFYTSADGVLRLPAWSSMRFAVDQYLEEDPLIRFHPTRVQEFIDEHGLDQLELM
jgi:hypothetical protein